MVADRRSQFQSWQNCQSCLFFLQTNNSVNFQVVNGGLSLSVQLAF